MSPLARYAHYLVATLVMGLVAGLGGCASPEAAPAPAKAPVANADDVKAMVAHELDDFHDAAAHANEARYFDHFDPHGVFLGTDAKERWDVPAFRAYAHARFATGHGWVFHATRRSIDVSSDGATAWFDEDLMGEKLGPARGSGVFVRSPIGRYVVVQYNLALTIPNERFGDVRALLDAPPAVDLKTEQGAAYSAATRAAEAGDLGEAHRLLAAVVPKAKTRPEDEIEFWLHNELTWIKWAEGDLAGALDEVDAAKATLDHGIYAEDHARRLRLHELWDRAYLLLERAREAPAASRAKGLADAEAARKAYVALAVPAGDHDGRAVLDAFFAARRGDGAAAKAAASQVDVTKDDDLQDLYVLALAFDVAKDATRADDVRARICSGHSYLMKPLILRAMKKEGRACK